MKKVMFVVVALLVATTCFAQLQSAPSNTVGYVKIVATGGAGTVSTPFGLPFVFWQVVSGTPAYGSPSSEPSDIGGDQLNCGAALTADRILRQDNGQNAIRNSASGCAWTGLLETNAGMTAGRAFHYQNRTGANRNFVLAGQVDNTGDYLALTVTNNAFVPYSWRDSRSVSREELNLVADGFTGGTSSLNSDRVVRQDGGTNFWYRQSDGVWQPAAGPLTVEPGPAYWIHNRNHVNGAWIYNYDADGGDLASPPPPSMKDAGAPAISKVPVSNPKTQTGKGAARQ